MPARQKLKRFIEEREEPVEIRGEVDTVSSAIDFLGKQEVDLIFSDIELLDGNVFEVYNQVTVKCPIIFTTAYDQFWMEAFETNGIAYLLKPFSKERFCQAWEKFLFFRNKPIAESEQLANFAKLIEQNFSGRNFKKRFSVKLNQEVYFLNTTDIAFFEANEGVVFAYDTNGKKHLLTEPTLSEIGEQLNPSEFFRINRSELISKQCVERLDRSIKNTLTIKLRGIQRQFSTSQASTAAFREWVEK